MPPFTVVAVVVLLSPNHHLEGFAIILFLGYNYSVTMFLTHLRNKYN